MGGLSVQDANSTTGEERNVAVKGTFNSAHVRPIPGTGGTASNRYIIAAAATHPGNETNNSATWTETENVTELVVTVRSDTAEVSQHDTDGILIVFDAIDATQAKAMLEDTAFDQDKSRQIDMIMSGQTKKYIGTSYFSRVDVVGIDGVLSVSIAAS